MIHLKTIQLEKQDVTDHENPMQNLTEEAFDACLTADIVIFDNRIVKNRIGKIGEITNPEA
jgi:hypothetical protein